MVRDHLIEKRKLNNSSNNNNDDDGDNDNDELLNNWLGKWAEQDMK